jgi:hypothetical protein
MKIKLKVYDSNVTVIDGVASSKNKFLEEVINNILDTDLDYSVSKGFLPELKEFFGKNIELISVEQDTKGEFFY